MPESKTDWERLQTQTDQDIEKAVENDPDTFIPDVCFWEAAKVATLSEQESQT